MKIAILILVLFHSALTIDQDPKPPKDNVLNEILCAGDFLVIGNKSIKFKKVVSDSRCPKGVTCVWAGEVKVLVEFYENGKLKGEKTITGNNILMGNDGMTTGSNISLAEFFGGEKFQINKLVVTPYPVVNSKINPDEYTLELGVSEKKND